MTGGATDPHTDRHTVRLTHVGMNLALHRLRHGPGRPLLCLHGLGEASPDRLPAPLRRWTGPVWSLDFTGHGTSSIPAGGGYTAEILMADADAALAEIGPSTVVGRGIGAYVALLIAGARPDLVIGAILDDGPGLAGGGPSPHSPVSLRPAVGSRLDATPDPYALIELSRDIRPADYAMSYLHQALQFSALDAPISVVGVVRPPWLAAVVDGEGIVQETLPAALNRYAAVETPPPR